MCRTIPLNLIVLAALCCAAAPQTQPVEPTSGRPRLLVLPVAPPPDGSNAWVSRAVQQDLVADLSQATRTEPIAPASATAAIDSQHALDAARDAGADFVLSTQAQVSANSLRVTGQLLDARSGQTLGALKATAPTSNLFPLEDSLAAQAIEALPRSLVLAPPEPTTQPSAAPQPLPTSPYQSQQGAAMNQPGSAASSVPQYYSYQESAPAPRYYTTYSTYYYAPYPYWGYYGYPWWGPDVLVFGYWGGYHHHDLDHDWDDWRGFHDRGFVAHPGYYSRGSARSFATPHGGTGGSHGGNLHR